MFPRGIACPPEAIGREACMLGLHIFEALAGVQSSPLWNSARERFLRQCTPETEEPANRLKEFNLWFQWFRGRTKVSITLPLSAADGEESRPTKDRQHWQHDWQHSAWQHRHWQHRHWQHRQCDVTQSIGSFSSARTSSARPSSAQSRQTPQRALQQPP